VIGLRVASGTPGGHEGIGCSRCDQDPRTCVEPEKNSGVMRGARSAAAIGRGSHAFRCRAHWERRRSFGRTSCAPAIETSRFVLIEA
jgi:hypothetical protein